MKRSSVLVSSLLALALPLSGADGDPVVPSTFVVEQAVPGVTFELPSAIAFLPDGRMLVAERAGRVWIVENGIRNGIPLWDGRIEVFGAGDCGLLGLTVDPDYATNQYVYFGYTVDPDSNGVDDDIGGYSRLTRYQMSSPSSSTLDPASRTILFGTTWSDGPVITGAFHTIGGLEWGDDGTLLVAVGDGASGLELDAGGHNPAPFLPGRVDPSQDIGAFRAQSLGSMSGKILRLDPANGHGVASNPFFDPQSPQSPASRIWSYGVRNPFRFAVRPGSGMADPLAGDPGSVLIGDVGWTEWEEVNVASGPGANFGWPCFEGPEAQLGYQGAAPDSIECEAVTWTSPLLAWSRTDSSLSVPPGSGLTGNCAILGTFYTGTRFPAIFQGALFFADFGTHWVKVARINESDQVVDILDFGRDMQGPVDFAQDPAGDLYYIAFSSGQVRRIRYVGTGGDAPGAAASANDLVGAAPFQAQFSSSGSYSPIGRPLTFFWNFGDGEGSSDPNPSHTYTSTGYYDAVLTVSDDLGGLARDTVRVVAIGSATFPTTAVLDDFDRPDGPIGDPWTGNPWGLEIVNHELRQVIPGQAEVYWGETVYGPDQEIFVTIEALTSSPHHTLLLKAQAPGQGCIAVRYNRSNTNLAIATYDTGQGWVTVDVVYPFELEPGDQFGARAYANGVLEVYRNGAIIHELTITSWPHIESGGRLGLVIEDATSSVFDDFGGGSASLGFNQRPSASISTPPDGMFFVTGDTVHMAGAVSDPEDAAKFLSWYWQVDQHHNNHVHPAIFTSTAKTPWFIAEHHDDGTGAHLGISLRITDRQGASDTAHVSIYPEVDLEPAGLDILPALPQAGSTVQFGFWLRNRGRMSAPITQWAIRVGQHELAHGDTLVPGSDSVRVTCSVPIELDEGTYTVAIVADALERVPETSEVNNVLEGPLVVMGTAGGDQWPPIFVDGPRPESYGVSSLLRWTTNEVSHGVVRYGTSPALGDSVPVDEYSIEHEVLLAGLIPSSRYHFVVVAADSAGNARVSAPDSFETTAGPTANESDRPAVFALSAPFPNPARGGVRLAADLPRRAPVRFCVYDLQGRAIWRAPDTHAEAGRITLAWPGFTQAGARVRPGVYLLGVELGGKRYIRRVAVIR